MGYSIEQIIDEVFQNYIDEKGFITIDKNPGINSTGNGHLHNAFVVALLAVLNKLDSDKIEWAKRVINESRITPNSPILNRNPWKGSTELTSKDEYLGAAAISKMIGWTYDKELCEEGSKRNWMLDNQNPDNPQVKSYLDRFPGLTAFFKLKHYPLVLIENLALAISIALADTDADSSIQNIIKIVPSIKESKMFWLAGRIWLWRAQRKHGTWGAMVKPYFKETHALSMLPWIHI
jgi:hypothetical protein